MDKPRAYEKVSQITLPDPSDQDPHPRLRVNGRGIHAGESFTALFPDGWHDITLEVCWDVTAGISPMPDSPASARSVFLFAGNFLHPYQRHKFL